MEELAGGTCLVWLHEDRPDSIQLLDADKDIARLDEAGARFELDTASLKAGAQAALALPDREITFHVGPQRLVGSEAQAA